MKAAVNIIEQVVVTWLPVKVRRIFTKRITKLRMVGLVYNDNDKTGSIRKEFFTHR